MFTNKTKGEKRKMLVLLWIILGFLYYHIRFTGGVGLDLINHFIVSDTSDELIYEEESMKAFFPQEKKLVEELASLKEDTLTDRQIAMDTQREGGTENNLRLIKEKVEKLTQYLIVQQQNYALAKENLIDKSDTSTEEAQLLSGIDKLAANTGLELIETSPVTNFKQSRLYDTKSNRVSTIPEGKRSVEGAPVVTDEQVDQILKSDLLLCRLYKFTGSPLLFYLFLKQLQSLEQDVFVLDVEINKSRLRDEETPKVEYTMMLVY